MKLALAIVFSILAISLDFPASSQISGSGNAPTPHYVTVCQVRASPSSYLGKNVRIRATYKTDNMFYAALGSPECKRSPKTINVAHPAHTKGDESVRLFFSRERASCTNQTVCPVVFSVDVEVLIKQTAGELEAEFKHVYSAERRT